MAAFTSVSLMSTSAWNGPGGSPIISPSRWNALVASNLAVIGNHNHAASAGEGASQIFSACYFPTQDVQYIYPWFPATNDEWVIKTDARWPGGGYIATSSIGATLTYNISIYQGQWKFLMLHFTGSAGGMYAASLGGSPVAFPLGSQQVDDEWWKSCYATEDGINSNIYSSGSIDGTTWLTTDTVSINVNNTFPYVASLLGYGTATLRIETKNKSGLGEGGTEVKIGIMSLRRSASL